MHKEYILSEYEKHPGRNPEHVLGGYVRYITVPVNPSVPALGTVRKYIYPPNPSRWLPHVGGVKAGNREETYKNTPVISAISRQQRRRLEILRAKRNAVAVLKNRKVWREARELGRHVRGEL